MVTDDALRDRLGHEFTAQDLDRIRTAAGGDSAELSDPDLLAAFIGSGVFAERIGDPRMRDELDSAVLAGEAAIRARVQTVLDQVAERGHPGAARTDQTTPGQTTGEGRAR